MPYTKDQARTKIVDLVSGFHDNESNLSGASEAQIENDYIRPLFKFFNWNTDNVGLSVSQWEFVLQRTDRGGKRPDYILQLDGRQLLVMDAKSVKYDIHDPRWMMQVYAYAYSTQNQPASRKIDFAILTNFKEFILLDCTLYAATPQAVSNFIIFNWTCDDYVREFDRLWELFERENIRSAARLRGTGELAGLWAECLTPEKAKANRIPPDKSFLAVMDNEKTGWRVRLAKDMKKRNPEVDSVLITAAVQLLINRLIFVKALSDREIEEDYLAQLAERVEESGLSVDDAGWFNACQSIFDKLNQVYNGSVFKPRPEFEAVTVSNKIVRDVIRDLQPENSPYNFAVLPVEILGTIYERFLGRVVEATDLRVKIKDKPEVRKAGGVYYTPQYIVDYIVQNTVGELLAKCKTPADVAKLRILDPACGSGSFLLGAYAALLRWHETYYSDKERLTKQDREAAYYESNGGIHLRRVRLTAKLKRDILLNNIFGVDIDEQAVEVTRFSLSLKALEDTRHDELYEEVNLFNQTVLPDLSQNIEYGNSLIGSDYFDGQMFDISDELLKIKPCNWTEKFDAVIGNPPWGANIEQSHRAYLSDRFADVADFESSQYFLMLCAGLLNDSGLLGMIVPNTFALNIYAKKARQRIIELASVTALADLSREKVFKTPSVRAMIIFLSRERQDICRIIEFRSDIFAPNLLQTVSVGQLREAETWKEFLTIETPLSKLVNVLVKSNPPLSDYCDVRQGYIPYRTTTLVRRFGKTKAREIVTGRLWHANKRKGQDYQKELQGADIERYALIWSGVWVKYGNWVSTYLPMTVFSGPRLLIREITGHHPHALFTTYTEDVFVHNPSVLAVLPHGTVSPKFILGVLNSRLMSSIFRLVAPKSQKGLFPKIIITDARRLPMPKVNLDFSQDKARHDKMVQLVESMLALHQHETSVKTQREREIIQRQIDATDKQIDELVYELYDLTPEETAIVASHE